jgi:ABC-2 type transport system permease protein
MSESDVSTVRIFLALLRRDITVARRELIFFLIRTTIQPLMFVIIFGFLMPKMGIVGRNYTTLMLPGIVAISLAMSGMMAVTLPMIVDFGQTKEIEDRLLAPIPNQIVAIEKIVNGTIQGMIAALFVLPVARIIMGPIKALTLTNIGPLLVVAILGGSAFAAMGLFLGTAIPPQQVGMMFSVILAPMMMFGCAYYPWRGLDAIPTMKWAVLINPLVYVAEGMRAAITPATPHMPLLAIAVALLLVNVIFIFLGLKTFMKRAVS